MNVQVVKCFSHVFIETAEQTKNHDELNMNFFLKSIEFMIEYRSDLFSSPKH